MRRLAISLVGAVFGATTLCLTFPAYAQPEPAARRISDAEVLVLRVGPPRGRTFVPPEVLPGPRRAAVFNVTFTGFTKAAKGAFKRAINNWANLISTNVPITVQANFTPLGPGVLGSARSSFVFRNFPGAPRPDTWYGDVAANKRSGSQLDPAPDIIANFSSVFPNWHFGTSPAPAGKFDFTTVVMHEIGHGLGFSGFGRLVAGGGTVQLIVQGIASPGAYDRFTENNKGKKLLNFPDPSAQLANQLQSGKLFYDSNRVRNANNNKPAKIFAPNPFQPGSSYAHLDEARFPNGNKNSLMTPQLSPGETIRSPGPISRAILKDVGL